jgi:hypothetical protein
LQCVPAVNSHVSFTHKTYDEITQLYFCHSNRSFHILFICLPTEFCEKNNFFFDDRNISFC